MTVDTVMGRVPVSDGFRASVSSWLRTQAGTSLSGPLASYIQSRPLYDPRLRELRRLSPNSDHYKPSGAVGNFMQRLSSLSQPPSDIDLIFNELLAEARAGLVPPVDESEIRRSAQAEALAKYQGDSKRIAELEAKLERGDRELAEKNQELSNLRGKLKEREKALAAA